MSIPVQAQRLKSLEQEFAAIYNRAKTYAVTITVSDVPSRRSNFLQPQADRNYETAVGSGFVFDSLGHIVTTSTVTSQGNLYKILFADGTSIFAELVGTDLEQNIAVLKVSTQPFPPPRFADSDEITPGLWIGVVANSFGVFPSFAHGYAAGVNKNDEILVTADLSPGSAGGLVVNSDGRVIGMIAYKLTEPTQLNSIRFGDQTDQKSLLFTSGEVELPVGGYSLVIPSNRIATAVQDIISGRINHAGFLGIYPEDLDMDWAKRVFNITYGVYIANVLKNSPAYRAGIREGDLLLEYNNYRILNSDQLRQLILNGLPGTEISISIMRGGKIRIFKTVLGKYKQTSSYDQSSGDYDENIRGQENDRPGSQSKSAPAERFP
jgi:serine protease Do